MRAYNFTDEEHAEFVRQTLIDSCCTRWDTPNEPQHARKHHAQPDELKDAAKVAENGVQLRDGVPLHQLHPQQGRATRFDDGPGPYDMWVMEYGYSVGLDDEDAEAARLSAFWSDHGPVIAVWQ